MVHCLNKATGPSATPQRNVQSGLILSLIFHSARDGNAGRLRSDFEYRRPLASLFGLQVKLQVVQKISVL